MRCWLCEYSDAPVAKGLAKYISDQAVVMGPELLAERVHETLIQHYPAEAGVGLEEVRQHILLHTLCPSVRVGCILRSLLKLSDRLESITTYVDTDTGEVVVDAKNVSVYLKVVGEIMQMYKTGEVSKLLFAQDPKNNG